MILTPNHLAVIRAALEYWNDEMRPHAPAVYAAYFEEPIGNGEWIKGTVAELREQLSTCRMRYVLCASDGTTLLAPVLFESPDRIPQPDVADSTRIATALISQTTN